MFGVFTMYCIDCIDCIALHCNELHYCIALHCVALRCIPLDSLFPFYAKPGPTRQSDDSVKIECMVGCLCLVQNMIIKLCAWMRLNVARQTCFKGHKSMRDGCLSWKEVFSLDRIPTLFMCLKQLILCPQTSYFRVCVFCTVMFCLDRLSTFTIYRNPCFWKC